MTLQAAFQSCGRQPQRALRAEHRRVVREQLGVCFGCGVSLGQHFDDRNNFLPCGDPRVRSARVQRGLHDALDGIHQARPTSRANTGEESRKPRRSR